MNKFLRVIFTISFLLGACGTAQTQVVAHDETSTPTLTPTATETMIPFTPTITPLPTIQINIPTAHPLSITVSNTQSLKLIKKISNGFIESDTITEISTFQIPKGSDGKFITAIGYESGNIQLIDLRKFEVTQTFQGDSRANGIAFSSDGKMVAVAFSNAIAEVWDISTGKVIKILSLKYGGRAENIVFANDNKVVVIQSNDCGIEVWDVFLGELLNSGRGCFLSSYPPSNIPITLDFLSEGGEKFTNPVLKTILFKLPLEPLELIPISDYWIDAGTISYSLDGKLFAKGSGNGWIAIWDIQKQQILNVLYGHKSFQHDGPPIGIYDLAFAPYDYLLASAGIDGTIRLWNVDTGKAPWVTDMGRSMSNVAFSPDGRYLFAGDFEGNVYIWAIKQ